nr:hypothetical protein Iba_chr07eCG4360 [Ipomoea batatas]GME11979.1 hypothetical protein Iba_scaffold13112CG0020 [Ipomoea batatas]
MNMTCHDLSHSTLLVYHTCWRNDAVASSGRKRRRNVKHAGVEYCSPLSSLALIPGGGPHRCLYFLQWYFASWVTAIVFVAGGVSDREIKI